MSTPAPTLTKVPPRITFADLFDVALKGADVAMPVLVTMLKTADLKGGLMVADEIWGSVKTAHKVWREQRDTIVTACNQHAQLVAALEYIRDLGSDGASQKYARAQAKAERTLAALSHPEKQS